MLGGGAGVGLLLRVMLRVGAGGGVGLLPLVMLRGGRGRGFGPLGDARRGRRSGGRCVYPRGQLALPSPTLLAPCCPRRPLGPVSGPCWGSVRRTRPRAPTPSSGFFSPCSVQQSCLPASSRGGPWLGASGKSLPKRPWEPGTSSCPRGSPGPLPCTGH